MNKGFSLLEVLVAFAILSLTLGVLMQVFATGLRNTALAEEYTQAVLHAQSRLALVGTAEPLVEGVEQDQLDDKYMFRSTVTAFTEEDLDLEGVRANPYRIVVEVFWDNGSRSVALETLRLAREDAL